MDKKGDKFVRKEINLLKRGKKLMKNVINLLNN